MSKQSSLNRKRKQRAAEPPKKWLIGIALGIVIVIAAIVYFAWPKTAPVTELKIEDLIVGAGAAAKAGDTLTVEYTGWLQDQYNIQPFDKPSLHQQPFQFVLGKGEVIAGWDQGLVGMKAGGKRKLTVPPDLGYGDKGALDGRIPPNAGLIFEVSLLNIQSASPSILPTTSVTALKIEDLVVGAGAAAKPGDTLRMNYTGWLENGAKFDSSLDHGQPFEFVLGQGNVIAGWDQGIVGMKVGGKRRLTIPPALGYGANGAGNTIPPNAALIFEVELLSIK
jgi:peptidylprolyl isomerase